MGQAKKRGTKEERIEQAIKRNERIRLVVSTQTDDPKKIEKVMSRVINDPQKRNLQFDKIEVENANDKEIKLKNNKITTIKYIPGTHCFAYSPWYD